MILAASVSPVAAQSSADGLDSTLVAYYRWCNRHKQGPEMLLKADELQYKTAEEALVAQYGESVDKSLAARIMGVTRSTVYAMLADGRVEAAGGGKRVNVRSIARYLA